MFTLLCPGLLMTVSSSDELLLVSVLLDSSQCSAHAFWMGLKSFSIEKDSRPGLTQAALAIRAVLLIAFWMCLGKRSMMRLLSGSRMCLGVINTVGSLCMSSSHSSLGSRMVNSL